MRALVYDRHGGPDVLSVREVPKPEAGPGEVLVRVDAIPVGPGDCKLRAGELGAFFTVRLPKVPGRYACGVVEAVGAALAPFPAWLSPGEPVVLASLHTDAGTAAEHVVSAPERMARKPAGLSHIETAALIQGGVTAWACLVEAGRAAPGERLLVHGGAGAVGSACVALGRHLGLVVAATCRSIDCTHVLGLGAHAAYAFDRPGEVARAVDQDIVVDTIGGAVHAGSHALLRRGGRLVYLNALPLVAPAGGAEAFGIRVVNARVEASAAALQAVVGLAERGVLQPRVAGVYPLEAAAAAHAAAEQGPGRRGRVVIHLA